MLETRQDFEAVETGHSLIEQRRREPATVTKHAERLFAVSRFLHVIPRAFERQTHHAPEVRFIVDNQNSHAHNSPEPADVAPAATGSVNVNVVPTPGSDRTVIWPRCASTMRREIDRPSPEPPEGASGTCTNGSKTRGR
jgi:hypothetical protein